MAFIVPNLGNRTNIVRSRIRYTGIPVTTRDSVLMGPLHIAYTCRKQMLFLTIAIATVNIIIIITIRSYFIVTVVSILVLS